jgi:acetyl-CoA carboxylase carboxyltransferase component
MRNTGSSVRDRIEMLIDPGTPLLELSTLAANQTYEGDEQLRVLIARAC